MPKPTDRRRYARVPLDFARGFLIGAAELVPGVSGGTVALVVGVYEEVIESAHHVVTGLKRLVLGPDRWASFKREIVQVNWLMIVPLLVAMATAVLTLATILGNFVTGYPELSRGLFMGFVAASVVVPLRMIPKSDVTWRWWEYALLLAGAVTTFFLTGLSGGNNVENPPLIAVFFAASVAICALVLPGVSGSFFLFAVGLYGATLAAVSERNLTYIGVFMAGAFVGLGSFVQLLRYLLTTHRRITLIIMTGLMIGSLRALWPWQGETAADHGAALHAPHDPILGPVLLFILGAVIVVTLIAVEAKLAPRHEPLEEIIAER